MAHAERTAVVYLCIIFESMQSIFSLPGWRHECILKQEGLVISDCYFGEGIETNSASKKVKKRKEWQYFVHYNNRKIHAQTGKKV